MTKSLPTDLLAASRGNKIGEFSLSLELFDSYVALCTACGGLLMIRQETDVGSRKGRKQRQKTVMDKMKDQIVAKVQPCKV